MMTDLFLIVLLATVAILQAWQLWLQDKRIDALEASVIVPQGCQHHHVENEGTFGLPEFRCQDCGTEVSEP